MDHCARFALGRLKDAREPTAAGCSVQGRSLEVGDEQQQSSEDEVMSLDEAGSLSANDEPQAEVVSTRMDRACGHFGPEAAAEDMLLSNLDLEETMHSLVGSARGSHGRRQH